MKILDLVVDTFMLTDWRQQDISWCLVDCQRWLDPAPRDATDLQYKYNTNTETNTDTNTIKYTFSVKCFGFLGEFFWISL